MIYQYFYALKDGLICYPADRKPCFTATFFSFSQYHAVQSSDKNVQEEDVMNTFDPYGTKMYKGMSVRDDEGRQGEEVMTKVGEKVGFKKRKKMGTAGGGSGGEVSSNSSSSSSNSNSNGNHSSGSIGSSSSSSGRNGSKNSGIEDQVKIKIEKVDAHYPAQPATYPPPPPPLLYQPIKTETIKTESVKIESVDLLFIKTEMKIEPKIEPVKTSFSFNGAKKMQKK